MSTTTDEILVKFRSEGGQEVEQHFKRVGEAGEHFGRTTRKTGEELDGLRLKSEGRVGRNLGELTRSLLSGAGAGDALSQTMYRLGESFRGGLALAGGVAIGFGIYESLKLAREQAQELEHTVRKIHLASTGNAAFKTGDQIRENLKAATGQLDAIIQRDIEERVRPSQKFLRNAKRFATDGISFADQDKEDLEQKNQLRRDAATAIGDLAKKTSELNHLEAVKIREGAREAELLKAEIAHRERLGELTAAAAAAGVRDTAATDAENRRFQNERAQIGYKFAVIDHQIDLEGRLTRVQELRSQGGLTAGQAAVAALKLQAEAAADLLRHYQKIGDADKIATQTILANRTRIAAADAEFEQFRKNGHRFPENDPRNTLRLQREQRERRLFEALKRDRANHGRDPGGHDTSLHSSGLTTHSLITSGLNRRMSSDEWRSRFPQRYEGPTDFRELVRELKDLHKTTRKAWQQ